MTNIVLYEQKTLMAEIVQNATIEEASALLNWSQRMLDIRHSKLSLIQKAKAAYKETFSSKVIIPAIKQISAAMKKYAWDDRGNKSRAAIVASAAALALFGGQTAGLAAFGTATAVPLWVVFGSGAAFVTQLAEELQKKIAVARQKPAPDGVIDAVFEVMSN